MKTFLKNKRQKGYAILFTVVVVSTISIIAIGISNSTYKQLILSSVAKDSHLAFYQSDTAAECALYADNHIGLPSVTSPWKCGINENGSDYSMNVFGIGSPGNPNVQIYQMTPTVSNTSNPCFNIVVERTISTGETKVMAKGYNICDANNLRKVERQIDVRY